MTPDEQQAVELVKEYARAERRWQQDHGTQAAQDMMDIERKLRDIGEKLLEADNEAE